MSDPFLQHLLEANRAFVDQIRVADQKAAYIFTFVLALMVYSVEVRMALGFRQMAVVGPARLAVTLILLGSIVVALAAAICVVLPRSRPGVSVFYWGAWPGAGQRLMAAKREANLGFIEEDLMRNTETLSNICRAKYQLVTLSFRALLVVVISYLGLLVIPA